MTAAAPLRLVFMGTPDFAAPALRALHKDGHDIAAVYCRPAAKSGRGQTTKPAAIARLARDLGLPLHTPQTLKTKEAEEVFTALRPALVVVVAYGHIIPAHFLAVPAHGFWNIHASCLPRWRGAAPIQRAIMAGDTSTGISIMQMDAGLDTGDVLAQISTPIDKRETAGELHTRLAQLGAEAISTTILKRATLTPRPQDAMGSTSYATKIDKQETRIDWRMPADAVRCFVHGLSPFPGAWFMLGDARIKLLRAESITTEKTAPAGTILDSRGTIACGEGALRLLEVQRSGKKPMAIADFLRATPLSTALSTTLSAALSIGTKLE